VLAYLSLAGLCLVSGILMPIPEDVMILAAGWGVQDGTLALGPTVVAVAAGTFARDALAYALGQRAGARLWAWATRITGEAALDRARRWYANHASATLFLTRFAIGFRVPLYFVGGSTGVPFRRFAALDAVGLALTTPLLLWIGARAGPTAADDLKAALAHQRLVLGLLAVALLLTWAWRRRRRSAGPR